MTDGRASTGDVDHALERTHRVCAPRIDAHQHFWHYDAAAFPWITSDKAVLTRDFLPGEFVAHLRDAHLQSSIAVQARQSEAETAFLLALADAHPFIAGVVGWVDLCADDVESRLTHWARHPRLVGMRHIVHDEPDDRFLLRSDFCRGVALLDAFDLTYDILIFPRHLPVAAEFVSRFPSTQRFIVDHLAKPDLRTGDLDAWAGGLRALASFPNVYAKLSGLVTEASWRTWTAADLRPAIEIAFDCFGAERLMIGSDWPVCTLAADYARTIGVVVDMLRDRTDVEREAVLGGTAARAWTLTR